MKADLLAVAAVMGSALASPHHVHGPLHKRGYPMAPAPLVSATGVEECTVSYTTYYGEASLVPAPPAPSTTETPTPTPSSTSTPCETSTSSSSVKPAPSPASSYVAASPSPASFKENSGSSSSSKSSSSSGSSASIGGGSRWAMTYSAYQGSSASSSSCKSSSQVMSDISQIAAKGFSAVRIYATDCQHLENVGAAVKANGLKLIPGIFIDSSGIGSDTYSQLHDIISYFNGDYSIVEIMVFGNEAIFNGYASGEELASFLSSAKSSLKSAGYSGPVTTTDTVSSIQANSGALCSVIDAVGANIHPFFNGNVQPSGAGAFVEQQMEMLASACSGKSVYNFETGWPSEGPDYMNAVPNSQNQATAIESIASSSAAGKSVFFSFENDGWKNNGSPSVEPYWGCGSVFSG